LSDTLTVGLGGDATRDHINFGPRFSVNTVKAGQSPPGYRSVTTGLHLAIGRRCEPYLLSGPFSSQTSCAAGESYPS
jgi:hypothetical protein